MRFLHLLLCLSLLGWGLSVPPLGAASVDPDGVEATPDSELTALNLASFDLVWTTVAEQHWDPALGGVDWAGVGDELRPRVAAAGSVAAAREVLQELLGRLEQSHFVIYPGEAEALSVPAGSSGASSSAQETAEDGPVRQEPAGGGGAEPDGASAGAEAPTAPEGADRAAPPAGDRAPVAEERPAPLPVSARVEVAKSEVGDPGLVPRVVDGEVLVLEVLADSAAAEAGIEPGWRLMAVGGLPVTALLAAHRRGLSTDALEQVRALEDRLQGAPGSRIRLRLRDGDGREHRFRLARGEPRGRVYRLGNFPPAQVWIESRTLAGGIGYIRFNAFLDPMRVMPDYNDAVSSFADAPGLILDLRGNPGGLGAMAVGMGGWLVSERAELGTMIMRDGELRFVLTPRPRAYRGPVAVLVDELSASTSEIFTGGLQQLGRVTVVGRRTAGAALPSRILPLPNGDVLQYAFANFLLPDGRQLEGGGVEPDLPVELSRERLLRDGDPDLRAALDWLGADWLGADWLGAADRTTTDTTTHRGEPR